MTVDHHKLNQVVAITGTGPDVVSLLEKTDTALIHGMRPGSGKCILFSPCQERVPKAVCIAMEQSTV